MRGWSLFIAIFFSMGVLAQNSLFFSGYKWHLKDSRNERVGPGANIFSAAQVSLDENGLLVLEITKSKGRYLCAEVISENTFGYGTYIFTLSEAPQNLHKNVVLGLFTYNTKKPDGGTEIDVEFSEWGQKNNANSQYVWHKNSDNFIRKRFESQKLNNSIHMFTWYPDSIVFRSFETGTANYATRKPYQTYVVKDKIPAPDGENVHINFWLYGKRTLFRKKHRVVVEKFVFVPLEEIM